MSSEANNGSGIHVFGETNQTNLFIGFQNQQSNSPERQTSEIWFMEMKGLHMHSLVKRTN